MLGITARHIRNAPVRFNNRFSFQVARSVSTSSARAPTARVTDSSLMMSTSSGSADPGSSAATRSAAAPSMSATTTVAPAPASFRQ